MHDVKLSPKFNFDYNNWISMALNTQVSFSFPLFLRMSRNYAYYFVCRLFYKKYFVYLSKIVELVPVRPLNVAAQNMNYEVCVVTKSPDEQRG